MAPRQVELYYDDAPQVLPLDREVLAWGGRYKVMHGERRMLIICYRVLVKKARSHVLHVLGTGLNVTVNVRPHGWKARLVGWVWDVVPNPSRVHLGGTVAGMRGLGKRFRFYSTLIGYTREREEGWMAADTV
jgi:hypothetical protein